MRSIRAERQRLKIPPFQPARQKVVREEALKPILARRDAAKATGLSKATIATLRHELGVPAPPRRTAWTKRALARLGKVSDEELARELGLKLATVQRKRQTAGLLKKKRPQKT